MTSCKSTDIGGIYDIPSISVIRPDRPTLEGTHEEMLETLLVYTFQVEAYCDILEEYIEAVNEIL